MTTPTNNQCDCGKVEHGRHHMNCPAMTTPTQDRGGADSTQPRDVSRRVVSNWYASLPALRRPDEMILDSLVDDMAETLLAERTATAVAYAAGLASARAEAGKVEALEKALRDLLFGLMIDYPTIAIGMNEWEPVKAARAALHPAGDGRDE